jgi:drug/metabolite transporter (DMT)-like permease
LRPAQIAWLIALGAIWGSSFLFMKIAVPAFGPSTMMGGRITIAAITLSIVAWIIKKSLPHGRQWKPAIIVGIFYVAIPLFMWGYAAQQLSASLLSIINATAPLFGAAISLLWLRERMSLRGWAGLTLGFAGVAVLIGGEGFRDGDTPSLAIAAAFLASILYGAISNYSQTIKGVDPYSNVLGSLWVATLAMTPLMILFPVRETPGIAAWGSVATLGILCTAIAYVVYFRLIEQIGAAPTLTVTYLVPVFGVLWGVVFLGEHVGPPHLAGAAMILAGITLVAKAQRPAATTAVNPPESSRS